MPTEIRPFDAGAPNVEGAPGGRKVKHTVQHRTSFSTEIDHVRLTIMEEPKRSHLVDAFALGRFQ